MRRNITYLILLLLMLASTLNSCTERIDIELEEGSIKLAVEGYIAPNDNKNYIRLTESANYFANEPAPTISNAVIELNDGTNTFMLQEDALQPGMYMFPDTFNAIQEHTYDVKINLAEEVGGYLDYTSSAYMPRLSDDIDSISVEYNTNFEFWMVRLYALEPPGPDYYMFNALRNDTLITDTISDVSIVDDELFDGNYMNGVTVMGFGKDDLTPGDKLTLILSNISEDYYNYIIEVQSELNPNVPIFSGPPANVRSNINNGAVGYFAAYPSAFSSTIVKEPN